MSLGGVMRAPQEQTMLRVAQPMFSRRPQAMHARYTPGRRTGEVERVLPVERGDGEGAVGFMACNRTPPSLRP